MKNLNTICDMIDKWDDRTGVSESAMLQITTIIYDYFGTLKEQVDGLAMIVN